ncbi:hypothetical protein D9M69_515400 [compost metagenome]
MPITSTSGMQITSAILSKASTIGSACRIASIAGKKAMEPMVRPTSLNARVATLGTVISIWPP